MYFYVHSLRKIRALRVLLVSPRFDGGFSGLSRAKRGIRAHLAPSPVFVSVMYPLCTLPSPNLPASDAICNPSPRFNVTLFGLLGRNAYILCNTLSGLRFCLVMYFYVHSLRKIRALRVLLVSPRFDVTGFARNKRNAYIRRNTLSGLRFAFLPASSYSKGGVAPPTLPSIMTKEGGVAKLHLYASPFGKGKGHTHPHASPFCQRGGVTK